MLSDCALETPVAIELADRCQADKVTGRRR